MRSTVPPVEPQVLVSLLRKSGQRFESVVRGKSMEPTLPDGAAIRIAAIGSGAHRVGQIVVYADARRLVAHRIVYCTGAGPMPPVVLTQGDGCLACDPPIRIDKIQGVVATVRIEGRWREPAAWSRPSWKQAVAAANVSLIKTCLRVSFRFARSIARVLAALETALTPH